MADKAKPSHLVRVGATLYRRLQSLSFTSGQPGGASAGEAHGRVPGSGDRVGGNSTHPFGVGGDAHPGGSGAGDVETGRPGGEGATSGSDGGGNSAAGGSGGIALAPLRGSRAWLPSPDDDVGGVAALSEPAPGWRDGIAGATATAALGAGSASPATVAAASASASAAVVSSTASADAAAPQAAASPLAPAPAGSSSDDGDETCIVCYDRPPTCVLLECGHGGFCRKCAHILVLRPPHECPTCRRRIDQVVELEGLEGGGREPPLGTPLGVKR